MHRTFNDRLFFSFWFVCFLLLLLDVAFFFFVVVVCFARVLCAGIIEALPFYNEKEERG
jgi:CHASE3 domain sensor protein